MRAMSAGAAVTVAMKPSPSRKRVASSTAASGAAAPIALATPETMSPASTARRWPIWSPAAPTSAPTSAPSTLNIDTTQPAPTRPSPSSARSTGNATGTLPIWKAATTPAKISAQTTSQRVGGSSDSRFKAGVGGAHPPPNPPPQGGRGKSSWKNSPSPLEGEGWGGGSEASSAGMGPPLDAHEPRHALRRGEERGARAFMHDLAALQHDDLLGGGERLARMLLDEHDGELVLVLQALDALEHDIDDDRRQALERLVHQQHGGIAHEGAADRQHLLLAARELVAVVASPRRHGEVLVDGERAEDLALLRDPADPGARAPMRRQAAHLARAQAYRAAMQRRMPHDRRQQRRLADAVPAEHGERAARRQRQRHAFEHDRLAIAGAHALERDARAVAHTRMPAAPSPLERDR